MSGPFVRAVTRAINADDGDNWRRDYADMNRPTSVYIWRDLFTDHDFDSKRFLLPKNFRVSTPLVDRTGMRS